MQMVIDLLVESSVQPECECGAGDECNHIPPIERASEAPLLLELIRDSAEQQADSDFAPSSQRCSARAAKQKRHADGADGERKTRQPTKSPMKAGGEVRLLAEEFSAEAECNCDPGNGE